MVCFVVLVDLGEMGLGEVLPKSQSGKPVKPDDGFITSGSLPLTDEWKSKLSKNRFERNPILCSFFEGLRKQIEWRIQS